jgi:hypothetical protein
MISKRAFRLIRLAPIVAATALLIPITALAAGASIQPTAASLVAKGAAIDITVTSMCPAGDTVGFFGASLVAQQAVSKTEQAIGQAAIGNGITCTGSAQTNTFRVAANVPGPPFRTGPALVSASMFACGSSGCISANSSVSLRVTN